MKNLPSSELVLPLQGNNYIIKFPKVGQFIDIESRKAILSSGQYRSLSASYSPAVSYIDVFATFTILIPDLIKDLRVESLFDLDLSELQPLVDFYEGKYLPWYNEWQDYLKTEKKSEEKA